MKKEPIKAFAYDESGSVIAEDSHISFNDAENIILTPDKTVMRADGEDLIFVTVSASDCNGNPVENANNRMEVLVSGPDAFWDLITATLMLLRSWPVPVAISYIPQNPLLSKFVSHHIVFTILKSSGK